MNYCFLDTNVFHGSNYKITNFFSMNFRRLSALADYGIIQLVMPEVTLQELYAHFDEKVDLLYELVGQAGLPDEIIGVLKDVRDKNMIRGQLRDAFQKFLQDTKAVTIPMDSLEINAAEFVRRRYAHEAPFTAKKEAEYQDLFAVEALRKFITAEEHEKDRLVIISNDNGFKDYCRVVLPSGRADYYNTVYDYRPLALKPAQERIRMMTQDYFDSAFQKLEDHLQGVLDCTDLDLPYPYSRNDYELADQVVTLDNPVVESVDIFEEEIYAYVKCNCTFEAFGQGLSEEKSEYDSYAHRYLRMVYESFRVNKDSEVRFIVNLFAETDDEGTICDIEDINEIDIVSELPFPLEKKDVETTVTAVENYE